MNNLLTLLTAGFTGLATAASLIAASMALGAWIQRWSTQFVMRHGFGQRIEGRLFLIFFFGAIPLMVLTELIGAVGWGLLSLVVLFIGYAPALRLFTRVVPLASVAREPAAGQLASARPAWPTCLAASAGGMVGAVVVYGVAMLVLQFMGMGAVAAAFALAL